MPRTLERPRGRDEQARRDPPRLQGGETPPGEEPKTDRAREESAGGHEGDKAPDVRPVNEPDQEQELGTGVPRR